MKQYEIHLLDRLQVPVIVRAYVAQDDLAALDEAERLYKNHDIEVWHGDRRVARVEKGNAALLPQDRQAL